MSARIEWSNDMATTHPRRSGQLPKKAVHWIGEIWLLLPSGEKDIRSFRTNNPLSTGHVQVVLGQLLDRLVGEHGKESAVSSGFWCKSR
jgi:hypothetical protein